jgi:multidrug efflux pump subunit AcrA (membrane-fusion protein)
MGGGLFRICSVTGAVVLLSGCFLFAKKGGRSEEFGGRRGTGEPPVVKVIAVRKETSSRRIETTVSLEGLKQVDVFSRVAGRLASLGLREGEAVRQGQILFKVDRTDPGENFLATPIESPVSGWVARWNYGVGSQITTQVSIVQIVDDHLLRATVSLPASEWALISSKTGVTVTSGGQSRVARVASIARAADPVSGRGTFDIEVENGSRGWRAGMTGVAVLQVDPRARMTLPAQALILTDQGAIVYVIEKGVAMRRPLKYEMISNDTVEVVEGLADGAQVVFTGSNMLSNGVAVRILEERKAP